MEGRLRETPWTWTLALVVSFGVTSAAAQENAPEEAGPASFLEEEAPGTATPEFLEAALPAEEFPFPGLSDQLALWAEYQKRPSNHLLVEFVDGLLHIPELFLDAGVDLLAEAAPGGGGRDDEAAPLCLQLFELSRGPGSESLSLAFLDHLAAREARYFAGLSDAAMYIPEFDDGTPVELDLRAFRRKQNKILWDTLRKTYTEKYDVKTEQTLKDDAFHLREWVGIDYAVLPPLVAGYVYYRGFDKKIALGRSRLTLSLEPICEWFDRDVPGLLCLEWKYDRFPLGLIVSVGLHDGDAELDFIGVGTSLDAVRRALSFLGLPP